MMQGDQIMVRSFATILLLTTLPAASLYAAEAKRGQGEKASDSATKVICKRFLETGSLVRGYRLCKTKAEWERARANVRQEATSNSCRMAGEGGAC
jgi:hypothetical protein